MTKEEMRLYRKRRKRILELHRKGIPHPEIAKRLGLRNRQRVWQIVNGK